MSLSPENLAFLKLIGQDVQKEETTKKPTPAKKDEE